MPLNSDGSFIIDDDGDNFKSFLKFKTDASEKYNPLMQKFERVGEGGPGSGFFSDAGHVGIPGQVGGSSNANAGDSEAARKAGIERAGQITHAGWHLKELPPNAPAYLGPKTRERDYTMEHSYEMYQKLDSDGKPMFENGKPVIIEERLKYYRDVAEFNIRQSGAVPVDNPVNMVMGGSSGAGKTELLRDEPDLSPRHGPSGAVTIDPDACKEMMADYRDIQVNDNAWMGAAAFAHEESSVISNMQMDMAVKGNYNVILDTTGDGPEDKFLVKLDTMAKNGGPIDFVYIGIPLAESIENAKGRAEVNRRYVMPRFIERLHPGVSDRFETIRQLSGGKTFKGFEGLRDKIRSVKLYDKTGVPRKGKANFIGEVTRGEFKAGSTAARATYNVFKSWGH